MDIILKSNLGYVVAKKCGSTTELEEKIGRSAMKTFATVGIIKLGYYNWSKLKLADELYIKAYGYFSMLYQIVKLKIEREIIMKKIANYLHAWFNNCSSMTPTGMIPMV